MPNDQSFDTRTTNPANRLVQAVGLSVAAVASGGGGGNELPASYQLSAGNYSARNVDPVLIYPRPDSETSAWAKHRRHYPGISYRVPIGVSFGSGPLVYEIITAPTGATIGEFLVVDGDKLIVNDDYGVLTWPTPTTGSHSFHVRVSFQDGFAPIDVEWTLEVTTTGTIFIDPVSGDDTTGDGSISNPFQTINSWWKDDLTDTTYSEFQVCYRGGTHDVTASNVNTGVTDGNWQLNGTDKPLVHYPYPGESVVWDMSNCSVIFGFTAGQLGTPHASDCYFGGIVYQGGRVTTQSPKQFILFNGAASDLTYAAGGSGQRITFDTPTHTDFVVETSSADNSGAIFGSDTTSDRKRHFFYAHRPTFNNFNMSPTAADPNETNFNGYYLGQTNNLLVEHVTQINSTFGKAPIMQKAGGTNWCIRFADTSQCPDQVWKIESLGSYDPLRAGPFELSYAKINNQETGGGATCLQNNVSGDTYNAADEHFPTYLVRSTFSRNPVSSRSALTNSNSYPFEIQDCLIVSDNLFAFGSASPSDVLRYDVSANPLDADLALTGADRTAQLGLWGHEVKNESV